MKTFLSLVTAPTSEPVDLVEARLHLRVDGTDEDSLILAHLESARHWAEAYTRRALIQQTWDLYLDGVPEDGRLELPLPPIQSVTHVKYYDAGGALQTWSSSEYSLLKPAGPTAERGVIVPVVGKAWPSAQTRDDAVQVRFVAGYGTSGTTVPASIRSGMLLYAAELYKNREQSIGGTIITKVPLAAERLLDPFRTLRAA